MVDQIRRAQVADSFAQLIKDNPTYSIYELAQAIYRRKNFPDKNVQPLHLEANDIELYKAIEITKLALQQETE